MVIVVTVDADYQLAPLGKSIDVVGQVGHQARHGGRGLECLGDTRGYGSEDRTNLGIRDRRRGLPAHFHFRGRCGQ